MSQTTRRIALGFCFALSLAVLSNAVQAQTLTVLHNFTGGNDGAYPVAGLTMDRAGNLYGTTANGGADNVGVVFRLSHVGSGWVETPLYSFNGVGGSYPYSGVVFGPDGSLYGTTAGQGGTDQGNVYRLRPSPAACHSVICYWEKTVLYTFTSGEGGDFPGYGNLVFDHAGNIYGTTEDGGFGTLGVVFELTPSNGGYTESVPFYFVIETGYEPFSGVVFDSSGNLYGTTPLGPTGVGYGVVYQLTNSGSGWTENILASNPFPHTLLRGGVALDGQGNVFAATGCGTSSDDPGAVFELAPSNGTWTLNVLHNFPSGAGPCASPTVDAAGNVYGTSNGTGSNNKGEVFKLTRSNGGWTYNSVSFDGTNGQFPLGSVIVDAAGNIYGTAEGGGNGPCNINGLTGCGVIWEITP